MNKLFATAVISALFTTANAQKTDLQWGELTTIDYGIEKKTFPKFQNEGYSVEANNVFLNISQKSNGKKYKITNPIWVKVDTKGIFDIQPLLLPENDIFHTAHFFDEKENEEIFYAKLATFKNVKGEIFRLNSFTIAEDTSSSNSKLARKSAQRSIGTTENPLKSGTFYKIKVDKSGIFKITKKFLADNGINISNINPKNFRIYGNGGIMLPEYNRDDRFNSLQENAIQVVGEEDGRWDDEDYALFYAQGPNGFNLHNSGVGNGNKRAETRTDASLHLQNIYEDSSYYFINFDIGEGKRIEDKDNNLPSELITRYDDYQFINEEKLNLMKIGRIWVGDNINNGKTLTFSTKSPIQSDDIIQYRVSVVANNSQNNTLRFSINGTNEANININTNNFTPIRQYNGEIDNLNGNSISININPSLSGNPNGSFYFDYAEVLYKEDLKFNGSQMNFRDYSLYEGSGEVYGFSISSASEIEQVWNVSDITNVSKMVNKSGNNSLFNFGYLANSDQFNNEFVAFKHSASHTPSFVGRVENQDLHSLKNIDYLIITKQEMTSEAKRLAQYHETKNGFKTAIVDVNKIYNEFSSGSQDITAIRDFISYLSNERGGLKYVMILGDTSYDFKNRIAYNDNIVPSYQSEDSGSFVTSYVTDDYFVMTRPQTTSYLSGNLPDIPIGRLPASNVIEAKLLIDKTLAYYNALPNQSSPFGDWRMKLDFVVDDDYDGGAPFHNDMNRILANNFESTSSSERKEYNVRKLYLDAFSPESSSGGQRYPQINQAISSDMSNSLYIFYFGHGGINGWAQERVLTLDEIRNFNNYSSVYSRFPLVSTITCEFTLWDTPDVSSAGEQVLKHKNGGASTMITSSRALSVSYGRGFTDTFTNHIFRLENDDFKALGDAHLAAKRTYGRNADHLRVNFLGDPAMKLSRPKNLLKIDNIETPVSGQLRALDFVKITGFISNEDGSVNENFNGRVSFSIFDKKLNKTTLNNDNSGGLNPKLNYQEEPSPIVKASGKAVNGRYSVEFYMPKEINYTVGEGRLLGYADNFESAKSEAFDVYHNQSITIGDINPNGVNDNEAPKIKLYMNNTNFVDGGITNQNPIFLACVTDDKGINSTGAGIGHDITVILDGEVINTISLNDYYTAGENNGCINPNLSDYQKGSVFYPFRNLKVGEHQLVFKVWDINNNSSTASLNFTVKDETEQKFTLNRLMNWPNPFTDKTYIQFDHNCNDALDVNVQIFTITGKLVKTISQQVMAEPFMEGFRTPKFAIEWDGTDDFGSLVGKGTYIYKVFARSQNQDRCKGSATAVEKMVILK